MNDNLPISILEHSHLKMVNFMRMRGTHQICDDQVGGLSFLEPFSKQNVMISELQVVHVAGSKAEIADIPKVDLL
jgi:hypothetical protein